MHRRNIYILSYDYAIQQEQIEVIVTTLYLSFNFHNNGTLFSYMLMIFDPKVPTGSWMRLSSSKSEMWWYQSVSFNAEQLNFLDLDPALLW
jgi:hypothetical protein